MTKATTRTPGDLLSDQLADRARLGATFARLGIPPDEVARFVAGARGSVDHNAYPYVVPERG